MGGVFGSDVEGVGKKNYKIVKKEGKIPAVCFVSVATANGV